MVTPQPTQKPEEAAKRPSDKQERLARALKRNLLRRKATSRKPG